MKFKSIRFLMLMFVVVAGIMASVFINFGTNTTSYNVDTIHVISDSTNTHSLLLPDVELLRKILEETTFPTVPNYLK